MIDAHYDEPGGCVEGGSWRRGDTRWLIYGGKERGALVGETRVNTRRERWGNTYSGMGKHPLGLKG
eukprot:SAG11_NODE_30086_length_304_cov_0.839024_1_plen_66_part_00